MTTVIKQETIRKKYVSLEVYAANGRNVYKVSTATECGGGFREDKSNIYTDLAKARATFNRYRREAKNN